MAKKIIIYGIATLAQMTKEVAMDAGLDVLGFLADFGSEEQLSSEMYLGDFIRYQNYFQKYPVVVAIGENSSRKLISEKIVSSGGHLTNVIHPSVYISESATLATGNILFPNAYIGMGTQVGIGNVILPGAVLSHDIVMDDYCFVAPNVTIAGFCKINSGVKFKVGGNLDSHTEVASYSTVFSSGIQGRID